MEKCLIENKFKYASKLDAEVASLVIYNSTGKQIFGSYKCASCESWHLTGKYDNRSKFDKKYYIFKKPKVAKKSKEKKPPTPVVPKERTAMTHAEIKSYFRSKKHPLVRWVYDWGILK